MKTNTSQSIRIGRNTIELSNTEKILFPRSHISKGDLIDYYAFVAPYMLPYCKNRLISMVRYPDGIAHEGFYQKNASDYFPAWIRRVSLKKQSGTSIEYVAIANQATIVYLANQGCITPHIWLSTAPHVEQPDRLIFDLDPSGKTFSFDRIKEGAYMLKELLEHQKLDPYVMTTGSRGLHVVVPLKRKHHFDAVRAYAKKIADELVSAQPRWFTTDLAKEQRGSKIFIDYLRNSYGATSVAPYAVRPLEGAPVATPLTWQELKRITTSQIYTIKTIPTRLKKVGDPWEGINRHARIIRSITG